MKSVEGESEGATDVIEGTGEQPDISGMSGWRGGLLAGVLRACKSLGEGTGDNRRRFRVGGSDLIQSLG